MALAIASGVAPQHGLDGAGRGGGRRAARGAPLQAADAELARVRKLGRGHAALAPPLRRGGELHDIGGPLSLGAAHEAMSTLEAIDPSFRTLVLDARDVPATAATGAS